MGRFAIVVSLTLLVASCVQPVHRLAVDNTFMRPEAGRAPWRKVAVLPFTGNPAFRRPAAEWFAFRVRAHGLFEIVDPSLAEIELGKSGILFGEADTAVEQALAAGRVLHVDGVVAGSIGPAEPSPKQPGSSMVSVRVVDMATGKVVADDSRSTIFWPAANMQVPITAAVDNVAADLAPVFHAAAGRPWAPPPKEEKREAERTGTR